MPELTPEKALADVETLAAQFGDAGHPCTVRHGELHGGHDAHHE
jgi:hypothetical protein